MAKKPNPARWIIVVGAVVFLGILIYLTMRQAQQEYEVCVTFKGRSHCAKASGPTRDAAVRSAQEIDCQMLASGRDETMVCLAQGPTTVRSTQK